MQDVTTYIPKGSIFVQDQATGEVRADETLSAVAEVNGVKYPSLDAAIQAANSASSAVTVTLLDDVTLTKHLGIGQANPITLNLNGKTINGQEHQIYTQNSGAITITGDGVITNHAATNEGTSYPLYLYNGSAVILDGVTIRGTYGVYTNGTLNIKKANIETGVCAIAVNQDAHVTIGEEGVESAVTVTSQNNCLSTQSSQGQSSMVVTIYSGTFLSTNASQWNAGPIYWASHGTLNVYGGTFTDQKKTAAAGVLQKNGTVNIYDGSFEARDGIKVVAQPDSTEITTKIESGVFTGSRSGIYVDASNTTFMSQLTTYSVAIADGSFVGGTEGAVYLKESGIGNWGKALSVSGGHYSSYNNNYGSRRGSQPRLFPTQSRSC